MNDQFDNNQNNQTNQNNQEVPFYLRDSNPEYMQYSKPKKRAWPKVLAIVLVVVLLVGTIGGLSVLYEIVPGSGNMLFAIARRGTGNQLYLPPTGDNSGSDAFKPAGSAPAGSGGPKMEISEPPVTSGAASLVAENNGELSIPQIAAKVTPSTVGVISKVASIYGTSTFSGTGIIMTTDGYIITNNHVIQGSTEISITLMDGSTYDAKLIGNDARSDLAVIKIEAKDLIAADFGDSDALEVGELAVAIGNPLGLELMGTVTDGIISAINRDVLVSGRNMTLIQTNAAINSGNSGGPLVNRFGQVIGINTLKMQDFNTSVEGLGFAIPTNTAKEIIDELVETGYVKGRPTIGITASRTINAMQSRYYNLPEGVIVDKISANSDAYLQGLKVNDIIVKAQGMDAKTTQEINSIKENFKAGDEFTLTIYRDGKYIDVTFKLMDEAELDNADQVSLIP